MSTQNFVWYELVTNNVDAALRFYGPLLGWEARAFEGSGAPYMIVSAKGKGVGGVMALPEGMTDPFWLGYVGTADIDGAVAQFTTSGGKVHRGPWAIPTVGRLALVSDPQGAGMALIQGESPHPSEAFDQHAPGHGQWHELRTSDPDAALRFYREQFGWSPGETIELGPMGAYQVITADGVQMGGIMRLADSPRPTWLYYFGIPDIHAAVARIGQTGGTVLHPPRPVPGGALIVTAHDPQGATFALVGPGERQPA